MVRRFNVTELPSERHFGAIDQVVPAGEVYPEPISIDALNDAMQSRVYVSPSIAESKSAHGASERDLTLLVSHDNTVEEIKLAAGDHIASSTFEVDLNEGSVTHYPLDSYVARLGVQLLDEKSSLPLPARVATLGYGLHTTSQPGADPNDVQLTTTIARSSAFALFALCAYYAVSALGCCALTVGILTFTDVRPPEATLIGALAAIAFAPPVLRNALPGSPLAASRRTCGCFCGPNSQPRGRLRSWSSNGRKPVHALERARTGATAATTSAWRRRADRSPGWQSTFSLPAQIS
jgi:hypothetical protein